MNVYVISAGVVLLGVTLGAASPAAEAPVVAVREIEHGGYAVSARFSVSEPGAVAREVLTDYANIPRFMPDVRTSRVLERQDRYARVEQEAFSTFMMFRKRIHLVLDVDEDASVIHFRDRCNRSFARYEGMWTLTPSPDGGTTVTYELSAQPAFSVPGFVLRKLLNRDAAVMIDRLRVEISERGKGRLDQP